MAICCERGAIKDDCMNIGTFVTWNPAGLRRRNKRVTLLSPSLLSRASPGAETFAMKISFVMEVSFAAEAGLSPVVVDRPEDASLAVGALGVEMLA